MFAFYEILDISSIKSVKVKTVENGPPLIITPPKSQLIYMKG